MCDNFPSTPLKMKRRSKGVLLCNFHAIFGGELICYVAMRQRVGRFNLKIPLISPTVLLQFFAGCAGINLASAAVLSAPVFQRTFYCLNRPRYMKEAKRERGNDAKFYQEREDGQIIPAEFSSIRFGMEKGRKSN